MAAGERPAGQERSGSASGSNTDVRLSAERAAVCFSDRFGQAPTWLASAPGRVNLIGEHTDYSDGFVLPMAIEARTAVAARPRLDRTITVYSAAFDESIALDLSGPIVPRPRHWSNYVAGVIAGIHALGHPVPGLDLVIESDVPVGAGLSSSAALEVAVATLVEAASGLMWDVKDKARLCQRAEHEFAGVPTGIMDQLIAVVAKPGCAVKIDCRSLDATYVDLTDPAIDRDDRQHQRSPRSGRRRLCESARGLHRGGPPPWRAGASRRDHRRSAAACKRARPPALRSRSSRCVGERPRSCGCRRGSSSRLEPFRSR